MPARAQLGDERVREDLGPAAHERHLRRAHGDPHRALLQLGLELRDPRLEVVDQPQRGRVEGALVVGERLDVPAHQLAQHRLRGRAETAADAGAEAQRAVGRDRPEPLGLGARGAAGRPRRPRSPGAAPERRTSSLQLLEERRQIGFPLRRNPCKIAIFSGRRRASDDCTGGPG